MNLNEHPLLKEKSFRLGIICLAAFILGGILLIFKGHDAATLAMEKKEGILTAETVKIAFENVGGRIISEMRAESDEVKKGDTLMELDSVDIDLAIKELEASIKQIAAQISQLDATIENGYFKTQTAEQQTYRQIEQQKLAFDAAKASYDNQLINYNRRKSLLTDGAISQAELDNSKMALDVAAANLGQAERLLEKMLSGTNSAAKNQVMRQGSASNIYLPEIAQSRQDLKNSKFSLENLIYQKENLLVKLEELKVKKARLTLKAPEDGKVLRIIAKAGEMAAPNAPVILLETKRYYYDLYIDETQAAFLNAGDEISAHTVAGKKTVTGVIRFIQAAPGFADLKMSREKGQADLTAFCVRIYVSPAPGIIPGMTVEVNKDEFIKR